MIRMPEGRGCYLAAFHEYLNRQTTYFHVFVVTRKRILAKAIQNNTEAEVSLDDGLKAVAIGQAAQLSIKEKRVVKLSELL